MPKETLSLFCCEHNTASGMPCANLDDEEFFEELGLTFQYRKRYALRK